MDPIKKLHELGQSIWFDNIEKRILLNNEMATMIAQGKIRGVTSNPSIFNNAISKTNDYDDELYQLAKLGKSKEEIYESLAIKDIQTACDLFLDLYDQSNAKDGFVSLEVSPYLANDAAKTFDEANRLWSMVDRPNLMIKIPATKEGLSAIRAAIANGVNVNVTLIFSLSRYKEVMNAYISGLDERLEQGKPISKIASVASFFISRIDTKVDNRLKDVGSAQAESLLGTIAVANAKVAYSLHKIQFSSAAWKKLEEAGGQIQRPLWASTSTKDAAYSDTMYVDELIGPGTVNTLPPKTLLAFLDHGKAALTLEKELEKAKTELRDLESINISLDEITSQLEVEGVKAFADSFSSLLGSIESRRRSALKC
jgi:transaldolase